MVTITVHSSKGGTGKSLIAVNLAFYYSKQDFKVLLIDGDYVAPCFESYFPLKGRYSSFVSFLQGVSSLEEVLYKTLFTNLYACLVPLKSGIIEEWTTSDTSNQEKYLKRLLEGVNEAHVELEFDKVIINNSSGTQPPSMSQLACSDQSIIVLRPTRYDIEANYQLIFNVYQKLRYLNSNRSDFFVWNQVPHLPESPNIYKIHAYLAEWAVKFEEEKIIHGTTIPYSGHVATEMITRGQINLVRIFHLIEPYINELVRKIQNSSK
ncbi:MAG: ParA family protein [Candidatus Hodarchaeales archaeon]|jgi:MinD-like ATPase involved in chromosome partitioning or flagellar assembly